MMSSQPFTIWVHFTICCCDILSLNATLNCYVMWTLDVHQQDDNRELPSEKERKRGKAGCGWFTTSNQRRHIVVLVLKHGEKRCTRNKPGQSQKRKRYQKFIQYFTYPKKRCMFSDDTSTHCLVPMLHHAMCIIFTVGGGVWILTNYGDLGFVGQIMVTTKRKG